ncbi:MAG: isoprenylcysteine carboxylmethyltransferase family protein [Desulfobacteraceae bacterium]|nr:isoprenylcysteine carboxylmethyltransferase family protein [Desulfobacteraceae bacterium]
MSSAIGTIIGIFLLVISGIFASLSFIVLRKHKTPFDPHKPTIRIVRDGPFRLSRNPLYLSMVMLLGGIALLLHSVYLMALTLVLTIVLNRGVIEPEERYLEKKFGENTYGIRMMFGNGYRGG